MKCRRRFDSRLEVATYCYHVKPSRRMVEFVDLSKCDECLTSYLVEIANMPASNPCHQVQFIHPRFDPFFQYISEYQADFISKPDYPVISHCLEKSYAKNFMTKGLM